MKYVLGRLTPFPPVFSKNSLVTPLLAFCVDGCLISPTVVQPNKHHHLSTRSAGSDAPRSAIPFKINTCRSVSKQRTLTPSRMNTYEKTGGGGTYGDRPV